MSDKDDFADVQVITLKQWLRERAYDRAWNECTSPVDVEPLAHHLLTTEFTHAKEFVKISYNLIQVGLNVSEIDDNAIDKAVVLLSEAESLQPGNRYEFGEQVKVHDT